MWHEELLTKGPACLRISLSRANCTNVEVMDFILTDNSFEIVGVKVGFGLF